MNLSNPGSPAEDMPKKSTKAPPPKLSAFLNVVNRTRVISRIRPGKARVAGSLDATPREDPVLIDPTPPPFTIDDAAVNVGSVRLAKLEPTIIEVSTVSQARQTLTRSMAAPQKLPIIERDEVLELLKVRNIRNIKQLQQNIVARKEDQDKAQFLQNIKRHQSKLVAQQATAVRPESLIYTLKLVNINNKLDPEVGKISVQIQRYGTTAKALPGKLRPKSNDKAPQTASLKPIPFKTTRKMIPNVGIAEQEANTVNFKLPTRNTKLAVSQSQDQKRPLLNFALSEAVKDQSIVQFLSPAPNPEATPEVNPNTSNLAQAKLENSEAFAISEMADPEAEPPKVNRQSKMALRFKNIGDLVSSGLFYNQKLQNAGQTGIDTETAVNRATQPAQQDIDQSDFEAIPITLTRPMATEASNEYFFPPEQPKTKSETKQFSETVPRKFLNVAHREVDVETRLLVATQPPLQETVATVAQTVPQPPTVQSNSSSANRPAKTVPNEDSKNTISLRLSDIGKTFQGPQNQVALDDEHLKMTYSAVTEVSELRLKSLTPQPQARSSQNVTSFLRLPLPGQQVDQFSKTTTIASFAGGKVPIKTEDKQPPSNQEAGRLKEQATGEPSSGTNQSSDEPSKDQQQRKKRSIVFADPKQKNKITYNFEVEGEQSATQPEISQKEEKAVTVNETGNKKVVTVQLQESQASGERLEHSEVAAEQQTRPSNPNLAKRRSDAIEFNVSDLTEAEKPADQDNKKTIEGMLEGVEGHSQYFDSIAGKEDLKTATVSVPTPGHKTAVSKTKQIEINESDSFLEEIEGSNVEIRTSNLGRSQSYVKVEFGDNEFDQKEVRNESLGEVPVIRGRVDRLKGDFGVFTQEATNRPLNAPKDAELLLNNPVSLPNPSAESIAVQSVQPPAVTQRELEAPTRPLIQVHSLHITEFDAQDFDTPVAWDNQVQISVQKEQKKTISASFASSQSIVEDIKQSIQKSIAEGDYNVIELPNDAHEETSQRSFDGGQVEGKAKVTESKAVEPIRSEVISKQTPNEVQNRKAIEMTGTMMFPVRRGLKSHEQEEQPNKRSKEPKGSQMELERPNVYVQKSLAKEESQRQLTTQSLLFEETQMRSAVLSGPLAQNATDLSGQLTQVAGIQGDFASEDLPGNKAVLRRAEAAEIRAINQLLLDCHDTTSPNCQSVAEAQESVQLSAGLRVDAHDFHSTLVNQRDDNQSELTISAIGGNYAQTEKTDVPIPSLQTDVQALTVKPVEMTEVEVADRPMVLTVNNQSELESYEQQQLAWSLGTPVDSQTKDESRPSIFSRNLPISTLISRTEDTFERTPESRTHPEEVETPSFKFTNMQEAWRNRRISSINARPSKLPLIAEDESVADNEVQVQVQEFSEEIPVPEDQKSGPATLPGQGAMTVQLQRFETENSQQTSELQQRPVPMLEENQTRVQHLSHLPDFPSDTASNRQTALQDKQNELDPEAVDEHLTKLNPKRKSSYKERKMSLQMSIVHKIEVPDIEFPEDAKPLPVNFNANNLHSEVQRPTIAGLSGRQVEVESKRALPKTDNQREAKGPKLQIRENLIPRSDERATALKRPADNQTPIAAPTRPPVANQKKPEVRNQPVRRKPDAQQPLPSGDPNAKTNRPRRVESLVIKRGEQPPIALDLLNTQQSTKKRQNMHSREKPMFKPDFDEIESRTSNNSDKFTINEMESLSEFVDPSDREVQKIKSRLQRTEQPVRNTPSASIVNFERPSRADLQSRSPSRSPLPSATRVKSGVRSRGQKSYSKSPQPSHRKMQTQRYANEGKSARLVPNVADSRNDGRPNGKSQISSCSQISIQNEEFMQTQNSKNKYEKLQTMLMTQSEKRIKRAMSKDSEEPSKRLFTMGGICCFLFFCSFLTTIFLFKILDDKVQYLNSLVVHPPTIRNFYEDYKNLFLSYDSNLILLQSLKSLRKSSENFKKYRDYTSRIGGIYARKNEFNAKALQFKKILAAYQGLFMKARKDPQNDRILEESEEGQASGLLDAAELYEDGIRAAGPANLTGLVNQIDISIKGIRKEVDEAQNVKEEKSNYFQVLLKNFNQLSKETTKFLKSYGEFYVLANRLWATSENIFELNKQRYKEITDELENSIYKTVEHTMTKVDLSVNEYNKWGRIERFDIKMNLDRRAVLLCQIQAKYDVKMLSNTSPTFDLTLVLNNQVEGIQDGFENEIRGIKQVFNIKKTVMLEAGENNIGVYAQVKKADILFEYVSVRCYRFIEMKNLKEY